MTDSELIDSIRNGDHGAFEQLFDRYWDFLFAIIYRRLQDEDQTKDLVQDIFIYIWNNRKTIYAEPTLEPLLVRTARNQIVSLYRKEQVRLVGEHELLQKLSRMDETDDLLLSKEVGQLIDEELTKMPMNMRKCFQLSRKEGKTISEIALQLLLSEQTVKNNISEALKRLKTGLGTYHAEYLSSILLLHLFIKR